MENIIKVKVGGKEYDTYLDENGTQRFFRNEVIDYLFESEKICLNLLKKDYLRGAKFSQRDYAEFNMMLGYSVCGFAELSAFQDMAIENPLWEVKDESKS